MRAVICILGLLLLSGVRLPLTAAESDAEAAARLRHEITELIGDARCQNLVNCRVMGLGASPCGGPEEYVAYSIWRTRRDDLETKVDAYTFLREEAVRAQGKPGSCEALPVPNAACVNLRCVVVPAGR
ncbi:MAG TPA: hypothetical protein VFB20_01145 [Burkholderiales bacterium]|nr:hypothetical protein [Burkholderiales bacterium]